MSGKSSGVFLNQFLPGEVYSGISVLTAVADVFSGIVGKFSEINLLSMVHFDYISMPK